ncbi:MAG: EamA family transporter [Chloroflexi bacterium]|nr:EamA family transporter [Chloroflexota bacterium]
MKYYLFILFTVILTVVAQVLIKIGMSGRGPLPDSLKESLPYIFHALTDWHVVLSLILGFLSFLFYLAALSKLELSYVYPFIGLNFVLIALYSSVIFHEHVSIARWLGIASIIIGVILVSRTGG